MGVILDDLYDHEGYGARRLPDGTLTGAWSAETATFEAYIASCGCGWHGGDHPPTEDGYEAAVEEWESSHARPLYARTVPDDVRSSIRTVKQSVSELVGERPLAGLEALRSLATWASATVDRLQTSLAPSTNTLERRRRNPPGRSLGL